jgi:class 3 adenylate cyclase
VELGLPRQLSIRIGVHAGPVYVNFDPVVREISFTGAHVSRAARIEPITHEGEVFASEEFAALAAADQSKGFSCDLVGTTALAKSYGLFRVYSLERSAA